MGRGGGSLYYDYKLNENGRFVSYGSTSADYSTSVFERKALAFLDQPGVTGSPFFLLVEPIAAHVPTEALGPDIAAVPRTLKAPRGAGLQRGRRQRQAERGPEGSPMSASFIAGLDADYRREAAALRATDRLFLHVYQRLQAAGVADRTYFVFATDHGWMWGDHRLPAGKGWEYDQSDRIPLAIAGLGIRAGSTMTPWSTTPTSAPTIAAWAGAGRRRGRAQPRARCSAGVAGRDCHAGQLPSRGAPGADLARRGVP